MFVISLSRFHALNIDDHVEVNTKVVSVVNAKTWHVPGIADVALLMEQTTFVADRPAQMERPVDGGIDAKDSLQPMLVATDILATEVGFGLPYGVFQVLAKDVALIVSVSIAETGMSLRLLRGWRDQYPTRRQETIGRAG